jgi:hypothetical protein
MPLAASEDFSEVETSVRDGNETQALYPKRSIASSKSSGMKWLYRSVIFSEECPTIFPTLYTEMPRRSRCVTIP